MKFSRESVIVSRNDLFISPGSRRGIPCTAIDYYEDREVGLGYDFSAEVFAAIQNIVNYPDAWPVIEEDVRRCLVNRFPFSVLYSIEQSGIFILAVMHLRRHPDYWRHRY